MIKTILNVRRFMAKEKFDGITRPSNDLYRKRFDEIFKKDKTFHEVAMEGYEKEKEILENEED